MNNIKNNKNGRINLTGNANSFANILHVGSDDFWDNIEDGIKPLVRIFVENGIKTYSSCQGHFDSDLEEDYPNIVFYCTPYIVRKIEKFLNSLSLKFILNHFPNIPVGKHENAYILVLCPEEKTRLSYDSCVLFLCEEIEKAGYDIFEDNRVDHWSLLVKPTNDCNLDCKYCYEKPMRDKLHGCRLSYKDIDHLLKLSTEYSKNITWIWHGGEPTLMGSEWYRKVQELFYKYSEFSCITQNMQTNGTRLDPSWSKLNTDYNINFGVSYDGSSQGIRVGSDTLSVKDNIKLFKEHGGNLGGICVINSENCDKQVDIYKHYTEDLEIGVSLNHIFHSDGVVENSLEPSFERFAEEYKKFLDYYVTNQNVNRFSERTAEVLIGLIFGKLGGVCSHSDCRYKWIGVNSDGSLYPCDRHVPERYCMGNIRDFDDISSIYETSNYKLYDLEIEKRKFIHCNDCGFYTYCAGGCNATHIAKSGDGTGIDEFSCELFKRQFVVTYLYFRDVDVYKNPLSPLVRNLILSEGFLTLKEIKEFLTSRGINLNMEFSFESSKDLLESKEFRLFRLFNPIKGNSISFHHDGINMNSLKGSDVSVCRELREKKLSKIFSTSYSEIIKIVGGNE